MQKETRTVIVVYGHSTEKTSLDDSKVQNRKKYNIELVSKYELVHTHTHTCTHTHTHTYIHTHTHTYTHTHTFYSYPSFI